MLLGFFVRFTSVQVFKIQSKDVCLLLLRYNKHGYFAVPVGVLINPRINFITSCHVLSSVQKNKGHGNSPLIQALLMVSLCYLNSVV